MRHSPGAGGLAQVDVVGEILVMSAAVMSLERLRGVPHVVAASARSTKGNEYNMLCLDLPLLRRCQLDFVPISVVLQRLSLFDR